MSMQALLLSEPGSVDNLALSTVARPTAALGQLLIAVVACAVNPVVRAARRLGPLVLLRVCSPPIDRRAVR